MTRTLCILLVAGLLAPAVGAAEHVDVETRPYIALGAADQNTGRGLAILLAPDNGDSCDPSPCNWGFPESGGARILQNEAAHRVALDLDDELQDAPGTLICWAADPEDDQCLDSDATWRDPACGPALLSAPTPHYTLTVWVYQVLVTSELGVCLGSTGTMSAAFS